MEESGKGDLDNYSQPVTLCVLVGDSQVVRCLLGTRRLARLDVGDYARERDVLHGPLAVQDPLLGKQCTEGCKEGEREANGKEGVDCYVHRIGVERGRDKCSGDCCRVVDCMDENDEETVRFGRRIVAEAR